MEPPHEVFHDAQAGRGCRVWISGGALSLSLHAMAFGKPEVWGHVLAGIAQQVAALPPKWATATRATTSPRSARF